MPAIIPGYLQTAHGLPDCRYIVKKEYRFKRTDSGKCWSSKPYLTEIGYITVDNYFNRVFAACTDKAIRISANYTGAGYLVDEISYLGADDEKVVIHFRFYLDKEYAKEIGEVIYDKEVF